MAVDEKMAVGRKCVETFFSGDSFGNHTDKSLFGPRLDFRHCVGIDAAFPVRVDGRAVHLPRHLHLTGPLPNGKAVEVGHWQADVDRAAIRGEKRTSRLGYFHIR